LKNYASENKTSIYVCEEYSTNSWCCCVRIGFDLDGVIRPANLALLRAIDKTCVETHWYYESLQPQLHPAFFLAEDKDECYIISIQRATSDEANLTKRWCKKFFPQYRLIILEDEHTDKDWKNPSEVYRRWNEKKAESINALNLDVYFEDNPGVVVELRKKCPNTKIIQYGGRLNKD